MIKFIAALLLLLQQVPETGEFLLQSSVVTSVKDSLPTKPLGNFTDDYGITYTITDTLWTQHPNMLYHIIKWNTKEKYIIARNDSANPGKGGGLYSRIDYTFFTGMEPWQWGFCLTVYDAKTDSLAENGAVADRTNPKKGCNGFPFSRMKKTD